MRNGEEARIPLVRPEYLRLQGFLWDARRQAWIETWWQLSGKWTSDWKNNDCPYDLIERIGDITAED